MASILADLTVVVHLLFIVFVIFGGLLVLRFRKLIWLHAPAVIWAMGLEFFGWFCPLTTLEQRLRAAGMQKGYEEGFIEHYLLPVIYPEGLTREIQIILGLIVLLVNGAVYFMLLWRVKKEKGIKKDSGQ